MDFIILLLSILVSAFGAVVGFGGGIFMIPLLVIVFNFPINFAIGAVVIALIPSSAVSSIFNAKNSSIDYKAAIILEIPTIVGTIIGAYLTSILPLDLIEIGFSIIILLVGIHTIKTSRIKLVRPNKNSFLYRINKMGWVLLRKTPFGAYRISYSLAAFFGTLSGLVAGFLGIGGGFIKVPIMMNIFKLPSFVASSTALFMIFFTSITGSISHYLLGNVDLSMSQPIVIGFLIGAFIGNLLNTRLSDANLKQLVGFGLILASVSILLFEILI